MTKQLLPAPPPVELDTRRFVLIGTILFALAAIVIGLVPALRQQSDGLWFWTALTGALLGIVGQGVMRWQKAP